MRRQGCSNERRTRDPRRRVGNRRRHCAEARGVANSAASPRAHPFPFALSHACAQVSGVALDAASKFVPCVHGAFLSIFTTEARAQIEQQPFTT